MEIITLNQRSDAKLFRDLEIVYKEMIDQEPGDGEEFRSMLRKVDNSFKLHGLDSVPSYWLAMKGGIPVGYAMIQYKFTDKPPIFSYTHMYVIANYRNQGIGSALLKEVVKGFQLSFLQMIFFFVENEEALRFLINRGGNVTDRASRFQLEINNFRGYSRTSAEFHIVENPNINDYRRVISTYNLAKKDEPTNLDYEPITASQLKSLTEEYARGIYLGWLVYENQVVSVSLLMLSNNYEDRVFQKFSGTHPLFRKRGFATHLKGAIIEYLNQNYPELRIIEAETHDRNISMQVVYGKLGFQKVGIEVSVEFTKPGYERK